MKNIEKLIEEDYNYNKNENAEVILFHLIRGFNVDYFGTSSLEFNSLIYSKFFTNFFELNQGYLTQINDSILSKSDSHGKKIEKIYDYVSQNYIWDEVYAKYSFTNIPDLIKEKKGNSAALNLFLVALLRNAELDAYPVLISTKDNGRVSKDFPLSYLFNHIICSVKIGSNYVLLNPINKYRPASFLGISP